MGNFVRSAAAGKLRVGTLLPCGIAVLIVDIDFLTKMLFEGIRGNDDT